MIAEQGRNFDLNIEKILEGWEVSHAIREMIANALDEQVLSGTSDIVIAAHANGSWTIRDFGRGLQYQHLTQNENQEKLSNPSKVIGKFGVGLKDALATLNRRGATVLIRSRFNDITLTQAPKVGFSEVVTLQAVVHPASDPTMAGTEITLRGITQTDMETAKSYFLRFSNETVLDTTPYGDIIRRQDGRSARIYVTGMLVAEEENLAFSYNITSLTAAMRKALNRERTNVGRTAYSDRVKQMLLASNASPVAETLVEDLKAVETGQCHDEVRWTDVAVHACKLLNASEKVIFVSAADLLFHKDAVDHARGDGVRIITVPDNVREALAGVRDTSGNAIRDLDVYQKEWQDSFQFEFIPPDDLRPAERRIFDRAADIMALCGKWPSAVKAIRISETMRPDVLSGTTYAGLWDPASCSIIIKRSELRSLNAFAGTLLHERVHALTGLNDVSREFESALTEVLGDVAEQALPA